MNAELKGLREALEAWVEWDDYHGGIYSEHNPSVKKLMEQTRAALAAPQAAAPPTVPFYENQRRKERQQAIEQGEARRAASLTDVIIKAKFIRKAHEWSHVAVEHKGERYDFVVPTDCVAAAPSPAADGAGLDVKEVVKHCLIRYENEFECSCGVMLADVQVSWDHAEECWQKHILSLPAHPPALSLEMEKRVRKQVLEEELKWLEQDWPPVPKTGEVGDWVVWAFGLDQYHRAHMADLRRALVSSPSSEPAGKESSNDS